MKIGDKIYYTLQDHSPDYVQTATILEETSRSWIIGMPSQWWARTPELIRKHGDKIPKKGTNFYSEGEAAKINWVAQNRGKLSNEVRYASTAMVLAVADLFRMPHP